MLTHANVLDEGPRIFLKAHHVHELCCLLIGKVPVDYAGVTLFVSQIHVFSDTQMGNQRQLLVNDGDAAAFAVLDGPKEAQFVPIVYFTGIRTVWVDAAEHIHQGRFPRAVFAYNGVDLALCNINIDIVQSLNAGKKLGDVFHPEDR